MSSIFISIAAQDEEYIDETIDSAINNSSGKNDLFFSILDQRIDDNFTNLDRYPNIYHEKIITDARGVGISRVEAMSPYSNQEFVMITDSHMIFNKFWDEQIIRRIKYLEKNVEKKCVISQHMPPSIIDNKIMVPMSDADKMPTSYLYFDGVIVRDKIFKNESYIRQYPVTCHFIFGRAEHFLETPFDPRPYYLAEESLTALRFFNNDIKIFAVDYNPMLHLIKPITNIENDWRERCDPTRMADDFEMMLEAFVFKKVGGWYAKDLDTINNFIELSGIDGSSALSAFGFDKFDKKSIEFIKNKIINSISENDFNHAVFSTIGDFASKSRIKDGKF